MSCEHDQPACAAIGTASPKTPNQWHDLLTSKGQTMLPRLLEMIDKFPRTAVVAEVKAILDE